MRLPRVGVATGVGSHAAHLLLRSGVGRLRLVDFDQVTLSSLNRHCLATRRDVGLSKSEVLARHFREIMPEAQVEDMRCMYTPESEEDVLSGPVDFVLDAIDNIDTKIALLAACKARGLPVLASAGAGAKADPTRLRVVDVSESVADPLARAVRHRLRRDHGLASGVPVLLSTERPRCGLVFGGEEGADPLEFQVVPGFRVRTIPVLGTMPAVFGLAAASWILCQLAGAPYEPEPVFSLDSKQIQTQWDRLDAREAALRARGVGAGGRGEGGFDAPDDASDDFSIQPLVDLAEVRCLVRELWRGRSARSPLGSNLKGMSRALGDLCLCRWELHRPPVPHNLVLLTKAEADAHEARGGYTPEMRLREPAFCDAVQAVLRRARLEFQEGRYM